MYEVLPVLPEQWRVLKEVRLRALEDAPEAFVATLAQAQARTDADWEQFHARWAVAYIAYAAPGGEPCGMIGGVCCVPLGHEQDSAAEMLALWVAPEHRRRGVAKALVDAVAQWAKGHGMVELHAEAMAANEPAAAFYRRHGFRRIDHPAPDGNTLFVLRLVK